jgi:hypothetical protein
VIRVGWVVVGLAGFGACGGRPHCSGPGDRDVQPAREVELPPIELGGFRLGLDVAGASAACTAAGGTVAAATAAIVTCASPAGYVAARLDDFGRVVDVSLEVSGDADAARRVAASAIDRALGGDGADFVTSWNWRAGTVYLHADGSRLGLRYDADDMHERVIYGLPNCP